MSVTAHRERVDRGGARGGAAADVRAGVPRRPEEPDHLQPGSGRAEVEWAGLNGSRGSYQNLKKVTFSSLAVPCDQRERRGQTPGSNAEQER